MLFIVYLCLLSFFCSESWPCFSSFSALIFAVEVWKRKRNRLIQFFFNILTKEMKMFPIENAFNSHNKNPINNMDSSLLNKALLQQYQLQSQLNPNVDLGLLASQLIQSFAQPNTKPTHPGLNVTPFQQLNNFQAASSHYFSGFLQNKNAVDPASFSFSSNLNKMQKTYTGSTNNIYYEYLNAVAIKQYNTSMQLQYCRVKVN
jgi:hypothetical protein